MTEQMRPQDRRRLRSELHAQDMAWQKGYKAGLAASRKPRPANRAKGQRPTGRVWSPRRVVIGFLVVVVLAAAEQHRLAVGVAAVVVAWLAAGVAWTRLGWRRWRERAERW
jgi:hypothetical protein